MTEDEKKRIAEHLRALASGETKPINYELGLCNELFLLFGLEMRDLFAIFKKWPCFSGNLRVPVSHPKRSPEGAFFVLVDLWDTDAQNADNAEYARKRLDLCQFIADHIHEIGDQP